MYIVFDTKRPANFAGLFYFTNYTPIQNIATKKISVFEDNIF